YGDHRDLHSFPTRRSSDLLLVMDVAIVGERGLSAFSFNSFAPSTVFSGSAGIAMLFVFNSFIGFEGTASYSEEARDPKRTVSRATYTAIAIAGIFFSITSWAIVI